MKPDEIKERFIPRRCDSQAEFDRVMCEIKRQQALDEDVFNEAINANSAERSTLRQQIHELHATIETLNRKILGVEQEKRSINRAYSEIKREMILLNPKDSWISESSD